MSALDSLFDLSALPDGVRAALGAFFWFALGSILMSLCGVIASRSMRGESVVSPPSHCDACGRALTPLELLPVAGYIHARGECSTCGVRVPSRHMWVELSGGVFFAFAFLRCGVAGMLWFAPLCMFMAVLTHIDCEHGVVPDRAVVALAALGLLGSAFSVRVPVLDALGGAAVGGGSLLLAAIAARLFTGKEGLGGGDVKLMLAAGLWLGVRDTSFALLLSIWAAGLVIAALLTVRKTAVGQEMPMVPFLAIGTLIASICAGDILAVYLGFVDWLVVRFM